MCRLQNDLARARKEGWTLGLKTVRGAYMVQERQLARDQSRPSPVHNSLQDTHNSYNRCSSGLVLPLPVGHHGCMVPSEPSWHIKWLHLRS